MKKPKKELVSRMKGLFQVNNGEALPHLVLLLFLSQLPSLSSAQQPGIINNHLAPPPYHHLESPFDRPTAVIMAIVVATFFLFGCLCVYARQCREQRMSRSLNRAALAAHGGLLLSPSHGLNPEVIKTFPTFKYSTVKNQKIGNRALECAVCLCEFENDDTLRLLPRCNHAFHPDCIDSWLKDHTTCPVCRANLADEQGGAFLAQVIALDPDRSSPGTRSPSSDQPGNQEYVVIIGDDQIAPARSPPIERSARFRSHSTGHSLVQAGEDHERFTLRLPEELRSRLFNTPLKRTSSFEVDLPRMKSSKKGFLSRSAGNSFNYERFRRGDRWGISMTPPFIMKSGSTRSQKGSASGDVGERSFNRLRPDTQV